MTRRLAAAAATVAVTAFARVVTGVRPNWVGALPDPAPRVYFANHASHGDFVLIWTVLPPAIRRRTRPVAGADYWLKDRLRRFLGIDVFDAVLIERDRAARAADPIGRMTDALDAGSSLILFPEGTRNMTEAPLLPFKSGLYHLAAARPEVDLVPVYIENLNRVMPKGALVPVPLLCTVTFGAPMRLRAGEPKPAFLARAEASLLALAPRGAPRTASPSTPAETR
ncbi:lysophospholipid acyltransferase family protein [Chthonobacter rhizosphaerae]|uniref:lysophospholipid acyltransferase family protein n=1 Tax=Chthonobacter rhizosphaerae TaxID=2735553 RepID=UPI0015EF86E7|nr:lysophospholipid acyltransferase family protein [Chthonobacter rhizosphaerae]